MTGTVILDDGEAFGHSAGGVQVFDGRQPYLEIRPRLRFVGNGRSDGEVLTLEAAGLEPDDVLILVPDGRGSPSSAFQTWGGKYFWHASMARIRHLDGTVAHLEPRPADAEGGVGVFRLARTGPVEIRDLSLEFAGPARGALPGFPTSPAPVIHAVGVRDLTLSNVSCHGAAADFVRLTSCWRPRIDVSFVNLPNEPAHRRFGYGVNVEAATTGTSITVRGRYQRQPGDPSPPSSCRHGVTTNQIWQDGPPPDSPPAGIDEVSRLGRPSETLVYDSQVEGASNAAFDTHSMARLTRFEDCVALQGADVAPSGEGGVDRIGFRTRGTQTRFLRCVSRPLEPDAAGPLYGFMIAPELVDAEVRLDGCHAVSCRNVHPGQEGYGYGLYLRKPAPSSEAGGAIALSRLDVADTRFADCVVAVAHEPGHRLDRKALENANHFEPGERGRWMFAVKRQGALIDTRPYPSGRPFRGV